MASAAKETTSLELLAAPAIEKRILIVRERQVMLDEDLADLYGVETRVLVQQVRRNEKRFPAEFGPLENSAITSGAPNRDPSVALLKTTCWQVVFSVSLISVASGGIAELAIAVASLSEIGAST
jgi:hypothetical protein